MGYQALQVEGKIGTMLPCNVIVQDVGDGLVEVSAVDPVASMAAINNAKLAGIATCGGKRSNASANHQLALVTARAYNESMTSLSLACTVVRTQNFLSFVQLWRPQRVADNLSSTKDRLLGIKFLDAAYRLSLTYLPQGKVYPPDKR